MLHATWFALFRGLLVVTCIALLAFVLIGANAAVIRTSNTFAVRVGLVLLLTLNAFARNSAHFAVFTAGRTFILWINSVPCFTRRAFATCRALETVWRAFLGTCERKPNVYTETQFCGIHLGGNVITLMNVSPLTVPEVVTMAFLFQWVIIHIYLHICIYIYIIIPQCMLIICFMLCHNIDFSYDFVLKVYHFTISHHHTFRQWLGPDQAQDDCLHT